MTEQATTPAWRDDPKFREYLSGTSPSSRGSRIALAAVAVAADRAHLATLVEAIPAPDIAIHEQIATAFIAYRLAVLAVLRDAP